MAHVQTDYVERIPNARIGQMANTQTADADSYVVENADGLAFGVACQQGTDARQVEVGVSPAKYLGITIKDITRDETAENAYDEGAHAAVAFRGDIWVEAAEAVTVGDEVYGKNDDGTLSDTPQGSTLVSGTVNSSATTINVDDGTQFAAGDVLNVGDEQVSVTSISSNALTVVRGYNGTSAAAISDNAAITSGTKLPGARWMSSASSGSLAVVRLSGAQLS